MPNHNFLPISRNFSKKELEQRISFLEKRLARRIELASFKPWMPYKIEKDRAEIRRREYELQTFSKRSKAFSILEEIDNPDISG